MDLNRLPKALRVYLKNTGLNLEKRTNGAVSNKKGGADVLSAALLELAARMSATGSDIRVTLARDLWTVSPGDASFRFQDGTWTRDGRAIEPETLLNEVFSIVGSGQAKRIDVLVDVSEDITGSVFKDIMEAMDDLKKELRMRYDPTNDNAHRYRTPYDVHVSLGIVLTFHGDSTDYTEDFLFHVIPSSSE